MRLNIGPLTIELSGVTEQEIPVNSRLFLDHKPATKEADRYYTFYFVNRLPLPSNDWQITFQRNDIVVFRKEEQETQPAGCRKPECLLCSLSGKKRKRCQHLFHRRSEKRTANRYPVHFLPVPGTSFICPGMLHTTLYFSGLSWASHLIQWS